MKNSKAILQVPGTMKIISAEIPVPKEDEVGNDSNLLIVFYVQRAFTDKQQIKRKAQSFD